MIKANELRLGNWITEFTVDYPDGDNIQIMCIVDGDDFSNCNPIPLTPEILEKCGFTFRQEITGEEIKWYLYRHPNLMLDGGYVVEEGEGITNDYDVFYLFFHYVINGIITDFSVLNMGCEYVHQLQNLYFALTGEELEIKL